MNPPLANVRVLDLTRILAGPLCTQILADLGAEVLKIEHPIQGDDTRLMGPFPEGESAPELGTAAFFTSYNRNKRSITIDLKKEKGRELILKLAAICDVFVENYKVGDLKRYGLDYEAVRRVNPNIIYCSVTGFGQTGPHARRAAYDSVLQAMSGMMDTTGVPDGIPGGGPMRSGMPITDILTGLNAAISVVAAVLGRDRSGGGSYIDISMLDVATAAMGHLATSYLITGAVPKRQGNSNPIGAPSSAYRSKDGFFMMSAGNNEQFRRILSALSLPTSMHSDPRFATNEARIVHRRILDELLEEVTETQSTEHWLSVLMSEQLPCAPINNVKQLFDDPQVILRQLHVATQRADGRPAHLLRSPLGISEYEVPYRPAPGLGDDNDFVLSQLLQLPEAERADLTREKVV